MTPFRLTPRLHQQLPSLAALMSSIMSSAGISVPEPTPFTPIINPLPRTLYPTPLTYTPSDFHRADELPDTKFYSSPRFVHHIDDACIARLKTYYESVIVEQATLTDAKKVSIIDLCSSWTSHLPDSLKPDVPNTPISTNHGIGLNAKELAANKHLTSCAVIDLNTTPHFASIPTASQDMVICSVSVDYLTRPIDVLTEIRRVLRPGGSVHFSFSNRCFPTKVVGKWLRMGDEGRRRWVGGYFWKEMEGAASGEGWEGVEEVVLNEGGYDDPLFVVRARKMGGSAGREGKSEL